MTEFNKESIRLLKALCKRHRAKYGQLLVVISGLSGAGKTYWGMQLAKLLGLTFIDQDSFYKPIWSLPKFTFSTGLEMHNWDCLEALDTKKQNQIIGKKIKKGVILSGFACRKDIFEHRISVHIHLEITQETCFLRRQDQHKDHAEDGAMIVNELVYPFYLETVKNSDIDATIDANVKSNETGVKLMNQIINLLAQPFNIIKRC